MTQAKKCSRCKKTRPLGNFNRHSRTKDGRQGFCRECQRASYEENKERLSAQATKRQRRAYQANPEKFRAAQKRWRDANPEKKAANNRRYREKYPENSRTNNKRYYDRHPGREKANRILRKAVQTDKIKKPPGCERCGKLRKPHELDGHHPDYADPLWVVWVDRQCHVDVHKEERGEAPRTRAARWFKLPSGVL